MSNFVVDVEADGPCPGLYSMVCLGAVKVDGDFKETFYAQFKPITDNWIPDALEVSGFTREEFENFPVDNLESMIQFRDWVQQANGDGRPTMWSDNIAFDWQFVNYYCHYYLKSNPFGFSGRRIGDYYCGTKKNVGARWKYLRKTVHDHDPVNDAKGNAEALWHMLHINFPKEARA